MMIQLFSEKIYDFYKGYGLTLFYTFPDKSNFTKSEIAGIEVIKRVQVAICGCN